MLRSELAQRAVAWAGHENLQYECSLGSGRAILFGLDEWGRHGNFHHESFAAIQACPEWQFRLTKAHTAWRRQRALANWRWMELDSVNSSDALLMNVFCHPETLASPCVRRLLGVEAEAEAIFGYRPGVPLTGGRHDRTEVDLRIGNLLVEAKLTEHDFQSAPRRLIERYRDLHEVFDVERLELSGRPIESYQLIRGVLAVHATPEQRFCVICDARRSDLIDAWHRVMTAVKPYDLRCRLQLLTWQELAEALPEGLQGFLEDKYGIEHCGSFCNFDFLDNVSQTPFT